MGERVTRIQILVEDVAVQLLRQSGRQEDVRVLGVPSRLGGRAQNLGAEALHCVDLLSGHLLRETDDHLVSFQCRGQREADARVTAGGLDQRVPRLDAPALLGLLHHALPYAILHRATRVEELHLCEQLALDVEELRKPRHADHGCEADQVERGVADLGVGSRLLLPRCQLLDLRLKIGVPAVVRWGDDLSLLGLAVRRGLHLTSSRHDRVNGNGERPPLSRAGGARGAACGASHGEHGWQAGGCDWHRDSSAELRAKLA
mmetsp:Transcript_76847/g.217803  ORF Transcript_76847/g.217803 Transcript_76847/m.217803 type:complete len:260 (+) Transcript_76847:978-1757(+)